VSALSDPRVKWLRCRCCARRFRNDKWIVEKVIDHMESVHPTEVYGFWREAGLLQEQAEEQLAALAAQKEEIGGVR